MQASGLAAFYSATADLVSVFWLNLLHHASEWVAGQNLADPTTWTSSVLTTLNQLHVKLLTDYRYAQNGLQLRLSGGCRCQRT